MHWLLPYPSPSAGGEPAVRRRVSPSTQSFHAKLPGGGRARGWASRPPRGQGCRYDARAQPRAARGMPRTVGRRPASDGADLAQRRESGFRVWVFFASTRNGSRQGRGAEGAHDLAVIGRSEVGLELDVPRGRRGGSVGRPVPTGGLGGPAGVGTGRSVGPSRSARRRARGGGESVRVCGSSLSSGSACAFRASARPCRVESASFPVLACQQTCRGSSGGVRRSCGREKYVVVVSPPLPKERSPSLDPSP